MGKKDKLLKKQKIKKRKKLFLISAVGTIFAKFKQKYILHILQNLTYWDFYTKKKVKKKFVL